MAEKTKIEWCDDTFNAWRGCVKVSPGCANCYAEELSHRNPSVLGEWGPKGPRIVAAESYWQKPLAWNRAAIRAGERRRVFCLSMGDVFEEYFGEVADTSGRRLTADQWWPALGARPGDRLILDHVRVRLGSLIKGTPQLDWLLLTKRPNNAAFMMLDHMFGMNARRRLALPGNVWLGASVEDQARAVERIPALVALPARVRFLSCEPLLGPLDLTAWLGRLDWVIIGGESGHYARPCQLDWVRDLVEQCLSAGVSVFVKQLGAEPREPAVSSPGLLGRVSLPLLDKKGGDPAEWPSDLRVRQLPIPRTLNRGAS